MPVTKTRKTTRTTKTPKTPKVFVVDRATWLTASLRDARGRLESFMLDEEHGGLMCCLGFVARQCGISARSLSKHQTPSDVYESHPSARRKLRGFLLNVDVLGDLVHTPLADHAMSINDARAIAPVKRERKLKALFRRHGYTLRFRGRYPKDQIVNVPAP